MKWILGFWTLVGLLASATVARAQDPSRPPDSVEDLLRRLDDQDSRPPVVPPIGPTFDRPLDPPIDPSGDPWAQSQIPVLPFPNLLDLGAEVFRSPPAVHMHRHADPVELLRDGRRDALNFWDAHRLLRRGDEIRQGGKSRTVIEFPDGADLCLDGPAILHVDSGLEDPVRKLELEVLKKMALVRLFEVRTELQLPGGVRIVGEQTLCSLRVRDLHELIVRNTGPSAVRVQSPWLQDPSGLLLDGGQEVILPLLPVVGRGPTGPVQEFELLGEGTAGRPQLPMRLRVEQSVRVEETSSELILFGDGDRAGVAQVAGARVVVNPGTALRVRRATFAAKAEEER